MTARAEPLLAKVGRLIKHSGEDRSASVILWLSRRHRNTSKESQRRIINARLTLEWLQGKAAMTYKKSSWDVVPTFQAKAQGNTSIDIGGGMSVTETASPPLVSPGPSAQPAPQQPVFGGGSAAAGRPVERPGAVGSDIGLLLNIAMYPWILLVGVLAFAFVSAPATAEPPGLNLHPVLGMGAFGITVWLYAALMRFLPTALVLAAVSALLSGGIAWSLSDSEGFTRVGERLTWHGIGSADQWSAVASQFPLLNLWVVAAVMVNVATHFAYWRQSRGGR